MMPTLCHHHASVYRTRLASIRHLPHGHKAQWEQVAREADHPSALRVVRAVEAIAPERLR